MATWARGPSPDGGAGGPGGGGGGKISSGIGSRGAGGGAPHAGRFERVILVLLGHAPQPLGGLLEGGLCPADVDLVLGLGGVGEDDDLVVGHLQEAAADGVVVLPPTLDVGEAPRLERAHEGRVVPADAEAALH